MSCLTCKHRRVSGINSFGLCEPHVKMIGEGKRPDIDVSVGCEFWVSLVGEVEYVEEEL